MNINSKKSMYVDCHGNLELAQDGANYIDARIQFILNEISRSYGRDRSTGLNFNDLYIGKWRAMDWRHYYHCVQLEEEAK